MIFLDLLVALIPKTPLLFLKSCYPGRFQAIPGALKRSRQWHSFGLVVVRFGGLLTSCPPLQSKI